MFTKLSTFFELSIYIVLLMGCANIDEIQPPVAEKIKKELTIHGDTRIDYYYWLKERENPFQRSFL